MADYPKAIKDTALMAYADVCSLMLTYAHVCSRVLTYADYPKAIKDTALMSDGAHITGQ